MPRLSQKPLILMTGILVFLIPLFYFIEKPQVREIYPWLMGSIRALVTKPYKAELAGQSHNSLRIKENEEIRIWVDFKNVGSSTWKNSGKREFIALNTYRPDDRESVFKTSEWEYKPNSRSYRPGVMSNSTVTPGNSGRFYITLRAPKKPGVYTESFKLVSEWREWIEGSDFNITITVDPQEKIKAPAKVGSPVRVGIYKANESSEIIKVSADGNFVLKNYKGKSIKTFSKDEILEIKYTKGRYYITGPGKVKGKYNPRGWETSFKYFPRIVPKSGAIMKVMNIESRPTWNNAYNFNRYRGEILVRHSNKTKNTWVINILSMEYYLRGVHELSNYDNYQLIKTFTVASRTFAQEIIDRGGKYKNGYFDVTDTTADQVYHGYTYELMAPNIAKSVNSTVGQMVTYDGKPVFTPYFARSDGRTRNSEDVWFSALPWLRGKADPAGAGQIMWGHGVGMSANGAKYFAEQKKWDYKKILTYYYSNTIIKDFY